VINDRVSADCSCLHPSCNGRPNRELEAVDEGTFPSAIRFFVICFPVPSGQALQVARIFGLNFLGKKKRIFTLPGDDSTSSSSHLFLLLSTLAYTFLF
jgi:hypothetical protein